ncbi:hypothetical protein AeMF1_014515 [Aphanomyces euteiches]|nr:hypothetical protein AeMF1_014515 [Aphanomyces euteiches]KAH9186148.1 hypothetical protein AeNC1_011879 [Aphanomyces euteiches]
MLLTVKSGKMEPTTVHGRKMNLKFAFRFTPSADIDLLKEILNVLPFDAPLGQIQASWDQVGARVASLHSDMLSSWGCRRRFKDLMCAFNQGKLKSLRASGTNEEIKEREELLQELSDKIGEAILHKMRRKEKKRREREQRVANDSSSEQKHKRTDKREELSDDDEDDDNDNLATLKRKLKRARTAGHKDKSVIARVSLRDASKRGKVTAQAQPKIDLDNVRRAYRSTQEESHLGLEKNDQAAKMTLLLELLKHSDLPSS